MNSRFRKLRLSQLDRTLQIERDLPPRPSGGWLLAVREALGLSLSEVGRRLNTPRQQVQYWERAEVADRITLSTLRRAAEAMDCEFVYVIVPKTGSFTQLATRSARERAVRDVESVAHTMALEDQKPENLAELIEDETDRRLDRKKPK